MWRKLSIQLSAKTRNKWFPVLLFLIIIIPPFVTGLFSYIRIKKDVTATLYSKKESIAYLSATIIKEKFDRLTDLGVSFSTRNAFRTLITQKRWQEATYSIQDIQDIFPYLERIFITDEKGIIRVNVPSEKLEKDTSYSNKNWYRELTNTWKPYVSEVFTHYTATSYNIFVIAIPIIALQNQEFRNPYLNPQNIAGILVLQVNLSTFREWIKDIQTGEGGFIYVTDQKGHIASHPKYDSLNKVVDYSSVPVIKKILQNKKGVEVTYNPIEKEKNLTAYRLIPDYNWGVVATQPEKEAFSELNSNLRFLVVFYGIILILSAYFAYFILLTFRRQQQAKNMLLERAEELLKMNEQLEKFAYVASHDLQEPLRTITSYVQLLQKKYKDQIDEEADEFIETAVEGAVRMKNIINDLLSYSRIDLNQEEIVAVKSGDILKAILTVQEKYIHKNKAIIKFIPELDEMPIVLASTSYLNELFQNLITNAIKFRKKKTSPIIIIRAEENKEQGKEIVEWHFSISDNGIGISEEYLERIFVIFQRLHSRELYPGTGIGLAICKKIVEKCGGKIWVESTSGVGSIFHFTLKGYKK